MSITARFALDVPDDASATLTLTMTIKEWRAVRENLGASNVQAIKVSEAVDKIIAAAEREFYERSAS